MSVPILRYPKRVYPRMPKRPPLMEQYPLYSLLFDGATGYGTYPDFNMLAWTELTFEVGVKPSSLPAGTTIIIAHGEDGLAELQMTTGAVRIAICTEPVGWYFSPAQALVADQWVHLVGTWKRNDVVALYVNGALVGTTAVPDLGLYDYTGIGATISAWNHGTSNFFPGVIALPRIYDRVLSPAERQHNIYNPLNPVRNGLFLWLPMIEGQGLSVADYSGLGNNGALFGGVTWSELQKYEVPAAARL